MAELDLKLLDALERKEFVSLTWGYVDGSFSRAQVEQIASLILKETRDARSPEDLIEDLIDQKLAFEFDGRIRTRFAETLRLLVRLRQLFAGRPWQGAPRLVSDFRVDLRRRRYPRRDRPASIVAKDNQNILANQPLRAKLWTALTEDGTLKLAGFQERSVVRLLATQDESGTIITAGTGSGKTKAFYLPALLEIADAVRPNDYWAKTLAIYPRNELLKDQFSEAYKQCRMLDSILTSEGRRPLLIGALFGSTPRSASIEDLRNKNVRWSEDTRSGAFICPWLKCPRCNSALLWRVQHIRAGEEKLECSDKNCGHVLQSETIVLTRERLQKQTPDLLFTTTEMLNQRMSDLWLRKAFGIARPLNRRPKFVLLDEVHTYSGTAGAQSALVLRRWRHLVGTRVTWVGLSATLREAARFFSELIGLNSESVVEITPEEEEMVEEGAEYQAILRGDPTLQASLLSTSIQAAMLLGRVMQPPGPSEAPGCFGKRVFAFTDDLDVTNRLFDNLRDAEAYTIFGREDPSRAPLAVLRGELPRDARRDLDGQRWRLCEWIGRQLDRRLVVGRTTSQDTGVLENADVVVATAALEVGYNDDQVGAVLQHKAPRSMASFVQRKGRAGRTRGMRPMTVTVLSEYGRDRIAYQAYEHLFDPVVPAQYLPFQNQYILRMQAVYAFIDWLAEQSSSISARGWMWYMLGGPNPHYQPLRDHLKSVLRDLARGDEARVASLRNYLEGALKVSRETVTDLMWGPPRSLMLEVVPTMTRRIWRDWKLAYPSASSDVDLTRDFHPLPEFIPRALFNDLSLPEVQVYVPPATVRHEATTHSLPILAALLQLAPGRVTRRFAYERGALNHWVGVSKTQGQMTLRIDEYAEQNEYLGVFQGHDAEGGEQALPVYRPWRIHLKAVSRTEALPTSTAASLWLSQFLAQGEATIIEVPANNSWTEFVSDVRFHLHSFRGSVAVRRFAHEVEASVRTLNGDHLIQVAYANPEGHPAGIGFELDVDGFYVDFEVPSEDALMAMRLPLHLEASARLAYLRYRLLSDKHIDRQISTLQREWLFQIFIASSATRAAKAGISLPEAALAVLASNPSAEFAEVLRTLFQVRNVASGWDEEDDEVELSDSEEGAEETTRRSSRLEERLQDSIGREDVLRALRSVAIEMSEVDRKRYGRWLRQLTAETLAQALLQACVSTAPLYAAGDGLVADLDIENDGGSAVRIWITETTIGGAGVIQAFAEAFAAEPRALFRALEAALAPNDIEIATYGLRHFVSLVCGDEKVKASVSSVCDAKSHDERARALKGLYVILSSKGLDVGHTLSVSLNARLLRPGMQADLFPLLEELLNSWEGFDRKFGIALGVREFSYLAVEALPRVKERLRAIVSAAGGATNLSSGDLVQVLESLLWPRGIEVRQKALHSYNPFRPTRLSDPGIVRSLLLTTRATEVTLTDVDWPRKVSEALAALGTVDLVARRGDESALRQAIVKIVVRPVDVGYMQFFPIVERIERDETQARTTLRLREYM